MRSREHRRSCSWPLWKPRGPHRAAASALCISLGAILLPASAAPVAYTVDATNGTVDITGQFIYDAATGKFTQSGVAMSGNADASDNGIYSTIVAGSGQFELIASLATDASDILHLAFIPGLDTPGAQRLPNSSIFVDDDDAAPGATFNFSGDATPIPEPASILVLLGGLAGLTAIRLRQLSSPSTSALLRRAGWPARLRRRMKERLTCANRPGIAGSYAPAHRASARSTP
jgi:hypothetical protein